MQLKLTDKAIMAVHCKATSASETTVSRSQDAFLCHVRLAKMLWWVGCSSRYYSEVTEPAHVKHCVSGMLCCQLPRGDWVLAAQ